MFEYDQAVHFIMSQLPMFQRVGAAAYKADLNNTIQLLNHLGNPQKRFRSIHVAGTNGKGSVSHMLASVLQEAGFKTGLYTSPHLTDFRERIRINGTLIDKAFVTSFVNKNHGFLLELKPSFFEMSVGLCFSYFASRNIDVAIVETGMGGRLDSTNVIEPDLSIITNIGLDHTTFLGNTIADIAVEKAGIIKPGIPVVIGRTQPETRSVFSNTAKKNKSKITFADQLVRKKVLKHSLVPPFLSLSCEAFEKKYLIKSPLAGKYQTENIVTVVSACLRLREAGYKIYIRHMLKGIQQVIRNTHFRGRWMVLGVKPAMILDTGHNADGLAAVAEMLKSLSWKQLHLVIGMVDDKDHASLLALLPKKGLMYCCKPDVPRGLDAKVLAVIAQKAGFKTTVWPSVSNAIQAALLKAGKNDVVFIGGSTFTVADALNTTLEAKQEQSTIHRKQLIPI